MFFDERGVELIAAFAVHRHTERLSAHEANEWVVAGITRIRQQHLIAGVDQYAHGKQQRGAGARGDGDALRRDFYLIARPIKLRDGFTQFGDAERRGVGKTAHLQRLRRCIQHRLRRGKIRLANA